MPAKIRILASSNKAMQRVGFLKLLAWQTSRSETSNLAAIGARVFDTVSKRVLVEPPFGVDLQNYARHRLADPIYQVLREAILANQRSVSVELQDLYLCDPTLPSSTGKLHKEGARAFAYLGTSVELIKSGTWSAMTRALVLLQLTPLAEREAFDTYKRETNPMRISKEQAAAVLFFLVDSDADVILPLFRELLSANGSSFGERTASEHLPAIIKRATVAAHRQVLNVEERERLGQLDKVIANLEKWRGKPFSALSVREEHVRVRLEPYCDLGFLVKAEPHRFAYEVAPSLTKFINTVEGSSVDLFLNERFFSTLASIHGIPATPAELIVARDALSQAGSDLRSPLGYAPVRECALLAGIRLLFCEARLLEIETSQELLRDWQKEMPDSVRFTVDRMGEPVNVKFIPARPRNESSSSG